MRRLKEWRDTSIIKCPIWKKVFLFFFFSPHQSVRVDFAQEYIYIYIALIESKYDTTYGEEGGRAREDEGEVGRLVLEGKQCRFSPRIYIYIYIYIYIIDQKYDTPCLGCH
jgi:hypothetical protein